MAQVEIDPQKLQPRIESKDVVISPIGGLEDTLDFDKSADVAEPLSTKERSLL